MLPSYVCKTFEGTNKINCISNQFHYISSKISKIVIIGIDCSLKKNVIPYQCTLWALSKATDRAGVLIQLTMNTELPNQTLNVRLKKFIQYLIVLL